MLDSRKILGGLAFLTALSVWAADEENRVVVRATGFTHGHGHAIAKLFRPGDDVLGTGRWQASAAIQDGQAHFRFDSLPAGAYALVVFHDENDNGLIDHNRLHLPSEPLGFSNGFSPGLFSGMPSFDKLRFEHPYGVQRLDITLK